ncbi:DUF3105 domain-containing protein [Deinococcus sp.]|uniref:DUF3105 domain-containing protein n=1 Tax=Deinococcus sp. TaxID=47478 RepID=UPI003B591648
MPRRLPLALLTLLTACSSQISGVQTFTYKSGEVRGGLIAYDQLPPAGGAYGPLWQRCGAYAQPIYPEYALHSLARGAVWLTYRPDLAPEQLSMLREAIKDQPQILLSPLPGQPSAVVLSAWNAQLSLEKVDDGRLKRFIQIYAAAKTVPEPDAGCMNGFTGTQ